MYPLHTNSLHSMSTFVPRPTSTFEPISPQQVTTPDTKIKIQNLHPKVHYPVDNRHLQAQPTLQTHHLRIHLHSRLYIHNHHNHLLPPQLHHTSPKPHKPQDKQPSPVKTNVNPPTQPFIQM